jgi:hypothetical protein
VGLRLSVTDSAKSTLVRSEETRSVRWDCDPSQLDLAAILLPHGSEEARSARWDYERKFSSMPLTGMAVGGDQISHVGLRQGVPVAGSCGRSRRKRPDQSGGIVTWATAGRDCERRRKPDQADWTRSVRSDWLPNSRCGAEEPPRLAVGVSSGAWLAAFSGAGSYRRHTGSMDCRSPERNAPAAGREGRRLSPPAGPG